MARVRSRAARRKRAEKLLLELSRVEFPTGLLACGHNPPLQHHETVKVEIRAAELAAMGVDVFMKAQINELRGWFDHAFGDLGPPDDIFLYPYGDISAWHAGWLAREILVTEE